MPLGIGYGPGSTAATAGSQPVAQIADTRQPADGTEVGGKGEAPAPAPEPIQQSSNVLDLAHDTEPVEDNTERARAVEAFQSETVKLATSQENVIDELV